MSRTMRKKSLPDVKLAILDNSLDPTLYNPVEHWRRFLPVPGESFRAVERQFPDLSAGYTHLILTGSEASIVEREEWVWEEVEFVRAALERGLSVLGSCYGHQLLALALRGSAHVRRCPQPEVGWIPVKILQSSGLLGRPGTAYTFSIHFDEVIHLDNDFSILASTPSCPVQAFVLKGKPVWGIQFHPEINVVAARHLLLKLVELNLKNSSFFEQALAIKPRDSGLIHRILHCFLTCRP